MFKAKSYFWVNNMTDYEKTQTMLVAMEGKGITWFQFVDYHMGIHGQEAFKQTLVSKFWLKKEETFCHKLLVVHQKTIVKEYLQQYHILASPLLDLPATQNTSGNVDVKVKKSGSDDKGQPIGGGEKSGGILGLS